MPSRIPATLGIVLVFLITMSYALAQGTNPGSNSQVPTKEITRTELKRYEIPGTHQEMRMFLIVYPPGVYAPIHHHPTVGLGYMLEGTAESAFGSDQPQLIHAGQSFQDKAIIPHTLFGNTDKYKPLKFLMYYTTNKGQPVTVTP